MLEIQPVHVAVAVIKNQFNKILISKRHKHLHQGDLWEFPGGKLEPGEDVQQALIREIKEELNLTVQLATPLIKINHQYSDLTVCLDVWEVDKYSGELMACEGQPIRWVASNDLCQYDFPAANLPIISAACLLRYYAILDGEKLENLQRDFTHLISKDIKLIQLRAKSLAENEIKRFIQFANTVCKKNQIQLLLNSSMANTECLEVDGLHLTSADLKRLSGMPNGFKWVGASCHTLEDLQMTEYHHLDFAVLGPVLPTESHPGAITLGWDKFEQLVNQAKIPVYALGGMAMSDQERAISCGAQGIAGIRAFLK